jgi:signal transduction histidine kinase/ActR/RegA family two-component response regulator
MNSALFGNWSIKRKLMLITMGVSTLALLLLSGVFAGYEWFSFRQAMTSDLRSLAELMGNQSTAVLSFDDADNAQEILKALRARPHILAACLYRGDKLFVHYSRAAGARQVFPSKPEPQGFRFEAESLVLFHPVLDKKTGEVIGAIYLKSDLVELHQRLARLMEIMGMFLLLSLPLLLVLSSLLQRLVSRPVFELAATARAVSGQRNYSLRATRRSHDELGQLIDCFNEMLAQIQQQEAELQQAQVKLEKRVEERTRDLQSEIIERRRAQDALQQQLARTSLLNQITHVISERQDLARILHAVLRQLEENLMVELGLMGLFEPETEQLVISALRIKNPKQTGRLDLTPGKSLPLGPSGLAAAQTGKTLYIPNTLECTGRLMAGLAQAGLLCVVASPLMVEDKLFGILLVARTAPDSFSSGECEFLRMLSEQVALAAHQARLHNQLELAYDELRQTQQTVMQQDRLRALGQMASGIAHDINNALTPVVGFAHMLLEHEPNLSPNAKKQLSYIRTAGEDVAHIVARLREFYRRRDDQEPVVAVDLNKLVQQVIDMTRPRWRDIPQGKGIMVELETELASDLPPVLGTASELREALTNLILNAVDAMPNGGKLLVRTGWQNPAGGAPGAALLRSKPPRATHVLIDVTDTGVGMDEETQRRCLEPFFSTKGRRGTGMGLAMVYGVMERHEGRIEVLSQPGQGTSIRLFLPLPAKQGPAATQPQEVQPPPPMHILCIDDEPLLRELVKGLLESDGHTVELADRGQTGIDAFRAARHHRAFDAIITDLGMPFMDGRQVARILKNESPATPVIMLTGWGAFMKADGELPAHVDGVLSKPPRGKELRETLSRLARR